MTTKNTEFRMTEDISTLKFRSAYVYRSPILESTNGGASSRLDTIYIQDDKGNILGAEIEPESAFYVDNYRDALRVKPYLKKVGVINDMFGGNMARDYKWDMYMILDRCESQEMYDGLSR